MEKVKINLGCGADYREGYINVDDWSMSDCKCDIKTSIFDYKCEPNSVDEILLSHVAMYIRPDEMFRLLSNCYQWLKKGGFIEIETIDLDIVLDIALNGEKYKKELFGLENIFGTKDTGPHRWGWSKEELTNVLLSAGFRFISPSSHGLKKPNRDYKLIAIK